MTFLKKSLAAGAVLALAGLTGSQLIAQDGADATYTKAQADAGRGEYAANCASCHGDSLTGGEMAPELSGGGFLSNWNGQPVFDLFDRIRQGMPPGKANLSRTVAADISAFILSLNGTAASDKPLDTKDEVLKTVKIRAKQQQ